MREFLDFLFADRRGLWIELRTLGGAGAKQRYFGTESLDALQNVALYQDIREELDVYVGVLPRVWEDGHAEATSEWTKVLYADVDAKHHDGSKRRALDKILDFPIPPSVIVDSGHGYHCYWKLRDLIDFDKDAQPIMKGIAKQIGGDSVYDRARILRVPGTHNHKDGESVPVRLIRLDTTITYGLADFDEFRYVEPQATVYIPTTHRGAGRYDSPPLSDKLAEAIATDVGRGRRSENDYHVVCWLIEYEWTDDEIEAVFLANPEGVGAKTAKSGPGYLRRTIRKARATA